MSGASEEDGPNEEGGFRLAVIWAYILGGSHQFITLAVSLAMARILIPEVWGTFAIANLSLLLARVLLRNGMASAIMQRKELDQRGQSTGFWILVLLSVVLAASMVALAPLWSSIFNDPADLTEVNRVLALVLPISVFNVMQTAVLQRDLNYRALTTPVIIGVVAGGITALGLAAAGAGIWALVGQQLVTTAVSTFTLWIAARWQPTLEFDSAVARDLTKFTGGALLSSIAEFIRNRADTIIIAITGGPLAVGIYRFAGRFGELVVEFAVRALQGALLPGLARLQGQNERLRNRILETYRLAALVAAVPIAGIFVAVDPLLEIVGVERWGASANAMRILAFAAMFQAIAFLTAPTLQAIGRPYAFAGLAGGQAVITVAVIAGVAIAVDDWSITSQVTAVAIGRAATNLIAMVSEVVVVARLCGVRLSSLVKMIRGPVTTSLGAGGGAWVLSKTLDLSVWVEAVIQGLLIALAFMVLLALDQSVRSLVRQFRPGLLR